MRWSSPSRRRRLLAVGLILALVAGGLSFLMVGRSRFAWDQACTLARRQLPGLLGADVGLGRCEVDPAGRTLSRIYDTNGIDLLEIHQTRGGNNELLFKATYNSHHRPLTVTEVSVKTPSNTRNISRPAHSGGTENI